MSPGDAPYWARGVAAVLLCFATWWLLSTQALRGAVGDSIALLSLGVIAVFMLRGLQLPLGIWPEGPWRAQFSVSALIGVAGVFSILIGVVTVWPVPTLTSDLEMGVATSVVIGAVAWGFAVAVVRQRPYLMWYAVAFGLAVLPPVIGFLFFPGAGDVEISLVRVLWNEVPLTQEMGPREAAAAVPTFLYLAAMGAASKLVTEEIAFRRLLIGRPKQAGIVPVTLGAVVAAVWYAIVLQSSGAAVGSAIQFGLAAFCAGAVYGLAGSLLVSATFSAVYWAAVGTFVLTRESGGGAAPTIVGLPSSVTILTLILGSVLGVFVVRQNGWLGWVSKKDNSSATGH